MVKEVEENVEGGDEEMDDDLKTKEDWDRVVVQAEADNKYAEEQLKKFLKSPRYLGIIDGAKAQVEEAKEKLSELRSPSDQLQHKLNSRPCGHRTVCHGNAKWIGSDV